MSDTTLDNIKLGKDGKEHDLTRFQKIEEERLNRNFRKLKEDIESLNGSLSSVTGELGTLLDSILLRYTETTTPVLVTDYGTAKFTYNATYYDLGKIGIVYFNPPTSVLEGQSFSTLLQLENLPFNPISASGFVRSLGSGQDGMDAWQLSNKKIYLRKRGGGNLLGTFVTTPILQVTIIGVY